MPERAFGSAGGFGRQARAGFFFSAVAVGAVDYGSALVADT
jgi:hypothetical protein